MPTVDAIRMFTIAAGAQNNRKSMFRVVMVCTTPQATLQLNSGAICKDRSYIYAGFFVLSACCP